MDSFERYVQPEVKVLWGGRLRLFPIRRWRASRANRVDVV
jgi:hypothetical protein